MTVTTLLLVSLMGASSISTEAVRWFPGDYFDSRVRNGFHTEVVTSWPGPSQLLELWNREELNEDLKISILLGGAAFHDPNLLPLYRESVEDPSQRVRQAAIYGFRDLLADSLTNVAVVIGDDDAAIIAEEMDWVMATLRQRTVLEMWLQSLLANEQLEMPGWRGVTFSRAPDVCIRAIEEVAHVHDLDLLLEAYDISQDFGTRVSLLKLIEGLTLSRFIVIPKGGAEGWGRQVFETAMGALEGARRQWEAPGCVVDGEEVLARNLKTMGVENVDPLAAEGCQVWVNVLDKGYPRWWMVAARRLYACGGPWFEMSALSPGNPRDQERRSQLLAFFAPLRPGAKTPRHGGE